MNLDHAVGTIVSRGFTERQARFLVLVARHSGVCVMRHYSAFAGVVFGHTTRKFFTKLERLGWVSTYDCARKRARIYHVRHRELDEAIGDAESRLRRPPTVPRALERIMLLDVILKEPDLVWLATSEEKMTHVSAFTAITKDSLPQMTTPQGSYEPVRYFPDQVPIGIHPEGRWIVVCLLTQDARRELRTFLERHLMFLAALPTWTLRVIIPAHMTAYGMRFVDAARRGLRWRFDGQFRDDLLVLRNSKSRWQPGRCVRRRRARTLGETATVLRPRVLGALPALGRAGRRRVPDRSCSGRRRLVP
jgi:hypothetical protein